jgi:hypothetical protein
MGKYFVVIFYLFFCSCNKKRIIYYEYNGVCVTRIDDESESAFYYGKFQDESNLPTSYVKSTFAGLNGGMDAYLIFKPNYVEVYYSMNYFENIGSNMNIKVINNPTSNTFNYNFDDKVRGKYDNVCRVSDILVREQELNANNNSQVKVKYP